MNADDMVGGSRPPGDVVRHSGAVMWQSGPWKLELRRLVDRCELQYVQMSRIPLRGWWEDAEQLMQLEKAVFLSAFIVRKLVESGRLSMQVEALAVSVTKYPARGPAMTPDPGNWEQLERFYDLHAGREESVPMRHLLNWVIHSFVFLVEERSDLAGGRVPAGFWCNSDRSKARDVVRVGWRQYRGMLDRVIADDVVSIVTLRDGHGGHVQVRSSELMDEEQRRVFNDTHRGLHRRDSGKARAFASGLRSECTVAGFRRPSRCAGAMSRSARPRMAFPARTQNLCMPVTVGAESTLGLARRRTVAHRALAFDDVVWPLCDAAERDPLSGGCGAHSPDDLLGGCPLRHCVLGRRLLDARLRAGRLRSGSLPARRCWPVACAGRLVGRGRRRLKLLGRRLKIVGGDLGLGPSLPGGHQELLHV